MKTETKKPHNKNSKGCTAERGAGEEDLAKGLVLMGSCGFKG
jgi:hypothetical protein